MATNKVAGFTDEERAAMQERARELKEEAKVEKNREAGVSDIMTKIGEMSGTDRMLAEKIHEIVTTNAPDLMPKTWYGMPAYANTEGKVICFFQAASKFKVRYATFGFQPDAKLDEGNMWPTSFAVKKITSVEEKRIVDLVKKAVG
jgi:uncharacterized protein YdhG (YjbR/CyaY superfamily)